MKIMNRISDAVLPSQELMLRERAYIRKTGRNPTKQQEKRWKRDIKRGSATR